MTMESASSLQQRQWGNNNNNNNNNNARINSSILSSSTAAAETWPTHAHPQQQQQQRQQRQQQLLSSPNSPSPPPPPRRFLWACLFLSSLISWGSAIEVVRFRHQQQLRREYYDASAASFPNNNNNNNGAASSSSTFPRGNNADKYDTETSTETATIAIYSITAIFLLTFVYLAMQLLLPQPLSRSLATGSKVEFAFLLLLIGASCTAVSATTNPIYGLAIHPNSGDVSYGNLYYSAWTCWTCVLALASSYVRTEYGIDVLMEMKLRGGKRLRLWIFSIVANLLVMASSATCYDAKCGNYHGEEDGTELDESNKIYYDNGQNNNNDGQLDPWEDSRFKRYCRRAAFGVSVGCIGCVASLSVVAMRLACVTTTTMSAPSTSSPSSPEKNGGDGGSKSKKISFVVECLSSWILLLMNCFSVAYLTSEGGPGAPLGNLFYATWITFILVIFLAMSCFGEVQMAKKIYQRRYNMQQGSSADSTMSDEGMRLESISSLNLSSNNNYERQSNGGFSSTRFDDYDSEDTPSMIVRSISGSVVEVLVGD